MNQLLVILLLVIVMGIFFKTKNANGADLALGQAAPEFTADATNDKKISLIDSRGKWVVLYFYPKAFTPGCTKEACSLRDGFKDIQDLGAVILGVSLDKIETQKKFKAEYRLPFELLSDTDKKIATAYNTLGFLGLYTQRKTFIIDPQGKLAYVFESVSSGTHDVDVAKKLKELNKQ